MLEEKKSGKMKLLKGFMNVFIPPVTFFIGAYVLLKRFFKKNLLRYAGELYAAKVELFTGIITIVGALFALASILKDFDMAGAFGAMGMEITFHVAPLTIPLFALGIMWGCRFLAIFFTLIFIREDVEQSFQSVLEASLLFGIFGSSAADLKALFEPAESPQHQRRERNVPVRRQKPTFVDRYSISRSQSRRPSKAEAKSRVEFADVEVTAAYLPKSRQGTPKGTPRKSGRTLEQGVSRTPIRDNRTMGERKSSPAELAADSMVGVLRENKIISPENLELGRTEIVSVAGSLSQAEQSRFG